VLYYRDLIPVHNIPACFSRYHLWTPRLDDCRDAYRDEGIGEGFRSGAVSYNNLIFTKLINSKKAGLEPAFFMFRSTSIFFL
jgi:hypothetical protein